MADVDAFEPPPGLVGRIGALLADPRAAWDAIAREEPESTPVMSYVWPLACLMALAGFIGGWWAAGFARQTETLIVLGAMALLGLAATILAVHAFAFAAKTLAPRFGAEANGARALQLSGYSATGVLLAGVVQFMPGPAPLAFAVGAVFSAVLVYFGLPRVMRAPRERRQGYLWSLIAIAALACVIGAFALGAAGDGVRTGVRLLPFAQTQAPAPAQAAPAPELSVLDAGAVNRLAAPAAAQGDAARLEGFLPQSLPGGFHRLEAPALSEHGLAQASALYANNGARLEIVVAYLGEGGASAVVGAAQSALPMRRDEAGYARHQVIDGRLIAESQAGEAIHYSVVGRRTAISIAGTGGASMDDARAATETIGFTRLEDAFPR